MSRLSRTLLLLSLTVCFGFVVQAASATSGAHFFSATNSVNNAGALVVSFDEAGVGQELVNYTLTVDTATATYACINGGGNHPKASNKETFSSSLATNFSEQPKNGRVMADAITGPVPKSATFECPSGQTLVLAQVTYSGITLTDTTNNVSISPTPDPICRSFSTLFPCP